MIAFKAENDAKKAQEFFRSKDKGDKSKHLANFVSHMWARFSFGRIQHMSAIANDDDNMHLELLKLSLTFMKDAFVIDNEKKLNVLKEKQGIDWSQIANKLLMFGLSHKLNGLAHAAGGAKKRFQEFHEAADTGAQTSSAPKTTNASIEDMAKKKREERMKALRRKAHNATGQAAKAASSNAAQSSGSAHATSDWGSSTNNSSSGWNQGSSTAASQGSSGDAWGTSSGRNRSGHSSTPSSWGQSSAPTQTQQTTSGWGQPGPSSAQVQQQTSSSNWNTSQVNSSSGWNQPAQPSQTGWGDSTNKGPAAGWRQENSTSGAKPATWGNSQGRTDSDNTTSIQDRSAQPRQESSENKVTNTWNQASANNSSQSDWGSSTKDSGGWNAGHTAAPAAPQDWGSSSNSNYPSQDGKHQRASSSGNQYGNPSSVVVGSDSAVARGRDWGDTSSHSATNTAVSAHDNQTDGSRGRSGGGWQQERQPKRPYGGNDRGWAGNKRHRPEGLSESSAPDNAGMGRGRGRTVPSWVAQGGDAALGTNDSKPMSNPAPRPAAAGVVQDLPVGAQASGRGRGRTLPAWMTQQQEAGSLPAQVPSPAPPPAFHAPEAMGGGRGRGRTLPAWMTQQQSGGP